MPRYYKYKCIKCGYILDEADLREELLRDREDCPGCGRDKGYLKDYEESDE